MERSLRAISGKELDCQGIAVLKRYEIRIVGELDADAADAFAGFDRGWDGQATILSSELDQAGLHGLLERIRSLGLELLDVRQIRGRKTPARPADHNDG